MGIAVTMRRTCFALLLLSVLAACAGLRKAPPPAAEATSARDIARSEPGKEDAPTRVFDDATRRASLAKRFPGAQSIDLVRFLAWTEERSGPCWTEAERPWEMKIDARYVVGSEEHAASLEELRRQGWLALYRTPNGAGFERRAPFESIDLTLSTVYACRCATGSSGTQDSKLPVRLRLRWQGKGNMPEVSASAEREGKHKGLLVSFAPGNLMSYEFPVRASYPGGRPGSCGGTLSLSLLSTPPMQ